MDPRDLDIKLLGAAFGVTCLFFLTIYWFNRPARSPDTTTSGQEMVAVTADTPEIVTPAPRSPDPTLSETEYETAFKKAIQVSSFAAAGSLDILDADPEALLYPADPDGAALYENLERLTSNYYEVQEIVPPENRAALHQELLGALELLSQANLTLLSAVANGDDAQAALGYSQLEDGYNQLAAVATKL